MTEHTDKGYEEDLRRLKEAILTMGGLIEEMVARSMKALVERNSELAREVIGQDAQGNQLEMAIDDLCLQLLALRQPAASDLRFIAVGLRISKDLERMGDLAVNISEQALELNCEPAAAPYLELPEMATKAQRMVKQALDAFVKRDAVLAKRVCEVDDEVDTLNDHTFNGLMERMKKDSAAVTSGTRLILVARHLERLADHATNIAEEVIFMLQGRDIRHGGK